MVVEDINWRSLLLWRHLQNLRDCSLYLRAGGAAAAYHRGRYLQLFIGQACV